MRTYLPFLLLLWLGRTAQGQWSTIGMPYGQCQHAGAANFSEVYAVGGFDPGDYYTTTIQFYDRIVDDWNSVPMYLTEGRIKIACAMNGDYLLCGGGFAFELYAETSTVEIYDLVTKDLYAVGSLSAPRVELSAASVGSKVLFAGGADLQEATPVICIPSAAVDIYDVVSHTWTTASLSEARMGMASAVLGNKVFFAGGYKGNGEASDRVDIYDNATDTWSTATLSQARAFFGGGATVGNKVFFAGGTQETANNSDRVDIYDATTDTWSTASLSVPRCGVQAAATGDYAIFAGGGDDVLVDWQYQNASDAVDIYNAGTDQWSTATMSSTRVNFAAAASGNQVFLYGGVDGTFADFPTVVDVFTDASTNGIGEHAAAPELSAWPNPFIDRLHLGNLEALNGCIIDVYDARGARVSTLTVRNTLEIDLGALSDGLYQLRILKADGGDIIASGSVVKSR